MNCARCGAYMQPGQAACPVCGSPVYPQGGYAYGSAQPEETTFLGALSDLPRVFAESFARPGEVLRAMVEHRDRFTWIIVSALVLLLSFLSGMVLMRGFLSVLLSAISALSGVPLASTSASMSQGVSYIAGRVGPMAGGIAALCQLIAMIIPTVVFMGYICFVCRVAFSWELASGFMAVLSLNTVVVSLLSMAAAIISPWLAMAFVLCSMALSYAKACGMLSLITARPDAQLLTGKLCCVVISLMLTLILCGVFGGMLFGGVVERVLILLGNVGSLI